MAKPEETGVLSARVPLEFFARVESFVTERDPAKGGRTRLMVAAIENYMNPSDSMELAVLTAERDMLKDELDRIGSKSPQIERIPTSKKTRPMAPLSQHTKARMLVYHCFVNKRQNTSSDVAFLSSQHTPNVSKRIQELAAEGYLEPSGEYRKSRDSNKMLTVWRRTAKQYTGGK